MIEAPLAGVAVSAATWPGATEAGALLRLLGATVSPDDGPALTSGGVTVDATPTDAATDWAVSGAMALTGRADGPPLHSEGQPATVARAAGFVLELLSARAGTRLWVDAPALLGERAALSGRTRAGAISVGGATRLLPAADGWWALSLARDDDRDLVPALVESANVAAAWPAIEAWSRSHSASLAVERAVLLGLPAAQLRPADAPPRLWTITQVDVRRSSRRRPLIVNLGALWAAPLSAQLLGQCGCDVIDVESTSRPDGARYGEPRFYELLHRGHQFAALDFRSPSGLAALRELLGDADVVIEASRPRALEALGVAAEQVRPDIVPKVWVRITAYGRGAGAMRVAFGDDAAVAGGLVARDAHRPVFAGDAIADPLTGLMAAIAALACLSAPGAWLVDLAMRDVAAWSCRGGGTSGAVDAIAPRARTG
jgi:hypothetical protein